jgi:DNA polymerase-1
VPPRSRRPILDVTEVDVDTQAEELLGYFEADNATDEPRVFARRGGLARVIETTDGHVMQPLTDRLLLHEAERVADWRRWQGRGPSRAQVSCKADKDIVYHLADRGHWPQLPMLESVYTSPTLLPSGEILDGVGYHRDSHLFMAVDPSLGMPPQARDPSADDSHRASLGLQDYLSEFRFAGEEDRANAFGMLTAHVIRPLMAPDAHLPVFLVDAPTAGSGKGLLINVASIIAQGHGALSQFVAGGRDADAEMRKLITSVLLAGRQFVHFDNLDITLKSPALSALVTSEIWSDRGLGGNVHLDLPLTTTFAASGNNLQVGGDMGRRVVAIRIDTGFQMPFLRTFKRMDLLSEVRAARGEILGYILTLARRWQVLGCPLPTPRVIMGSFQSVVDVIGGVLQVAEIGGWMGNLLRFAEAENTELTEWTRFIHAWYGRWGEQPQLAKTVAEACNDPHDPSLREALPDYVRPYTDIERAKLPASLGAFLRSRQDQVFDGLQLRRAGLDRANTTLWQVRPADSGSSPASPSPAQPPENTPEDPMNARAREDAGLAGLAGPLVAPSIPYALPVPLPLPRTRNRATSGPASPASPATTATLTQARAHVRALRADARVAVDTETTGLHVWEGHRLRLLQVASADRVEVYDLWSEPDGLKILEVWRPILEGRAGVRVGYHNAKFDLTMLQAAGITLPPPQMIGDTYLASLLLDNASGPRPRQTLKALAARHLGRDLPKEMQKSDWSGTLSQEQVDYAAEDARATYELMGILEDRLETEGLRQVYETELAIVPIIVELGLRGVRIDPERWAPLAENAERKLAEYGVVLREIAQAAGFADFNPRSPQQVQAVLKARGISIASTDESYLLEHAEDAFVSAMLGYRQWFKGVTTYGLSVLKALDDAERFHADYNQAETRTGRMTADIIHQMPKDGGYREAVRPIEGRCLIKADYTQLQVVIVADLSEATSMIETFNQGRDIHAETASRVLGVHPSQVTAHQRQAAKALNFGLLFGGGAATLQRHAKGYGVDWSLAEAKAMRTRFFEEYPEIKRWHVNRPGVVRHQWPEFDEDLPVDLCTDSGRRRLQVSKYTEKHNTPVQMMEVDGVKDGLKLLDDALKRRKLDAQIVMVVHDEVDIEASEADALEVAELAQECLEAGMNRWLKYARAVIDVDVYRDWHGTRLVSQWPRGK